MTKKRSSDPNARDRILRAAEKVFARQGYKGATIDAISSTAKVNRALLYYYFKDKEALYNSLVEQGVKAFDDIFEGLSKEGPSIRDKLHTFLSEFCNLLLTKRGFVRMVHRELASGGEAGGKLISGHFQNSLHQLAHLIREGVASGELRPVDDEMAACSLLGMIDIFNTRMLLRNEPVDADRVVSHTLDLFMQGAGAKSTGRRSSANAV